MKIFVILPGLLIIQCLILSPASAQKKVKCALLIPNEERDSTCITYEDIDRAFASARKKVGLKAPNRQSNAPNNVDTDLLGRTIVETSRILAEKFKLSVGDINKGLPLINTKKTEVGAFCPDYFKEPDCEVERFRRPDGSCNNPKVGVRGAVLTALRRLLPADYADGLMAPRVSVTGKPLPSARAVSAAVHRDFNFHDHAVTTLLVSWSQMIDHDMAFGGTVPDPRTNDDPVCCGVRQEAQAQSCLPISIPKDDPFYSLFRQTCMEFTRTATGLRDSCRLGVRGGMNAVTTYLDASHIYGLSENQTRSLRLMRGGLLRSNPVFERDGLKDLPPPNTQDPDQLCSRNNNTDLFCFLTGDVRANQQMFLTTIHILLMREHNRLASELGQVNPQWDDERIFQETRHIMSALIQHITYKEFLPLVLGKETMKTYDLLPLKKGYLEGYDPKIDATLSTAFFTSAYRFGHSLIPPTIERWSPSHKFISSIRLSDQFFQPFEAYQPGALDQFVAGLINQVSQALDDAMTAEVTNHLFRERPNNFGMDLASRNIHRGREHGVPSYNTFRAYCGLKPAETWVDLAGVFPNDTLTRYAQVYSSPDDIDLWSGGISEEPQRGSMVGPVFACILGEGFRNLRFGDRFWYENPGWPSSFTLDQLNEIRKVKLARIICDNTDRIDSVQKNAMALPDSNNNPRVPCKGSVLPRIDLSAWKE